MQFVCKNAGVFSEECCGILHELLETGTDTNVRYIAMDLRDIALLDRHPVKYLSRRGLIQNLMDGFGMIE